ncbi:uncharacterized protein LOC124435909 isoform X2 [Xenia sp. Carnegie-2017]|uniref:uncharacterized protein LOC124435909 isoform X2 n=1 Tax=Xenia sp. Carnegie-2017 TaxID=2897299 RepID=UPI001F045D30|nr:uncharacterized protein LOC124435909 isoform X2 [Xenia sp. Carnegie-2017]
MYQFRKKFRRSNDFFYNNVERKGNTQKDDANSSVSYESQFFEQENEFGDLNEQSEDIAENYDKHQELTTKTQSHLSPTGHYTGLLLQFDFASNVSRQQSFVVHDYNANKRTIMHNSFVFVHRYPHLLLDGYGWILCCSCDANRKQFVEALPNNIQLDPQKESTSMMQSVFSDHSYHEMQPEEDLFSAVCREVQWIAVKPVNSPWGVCTFVYSKVTPPQPELKCCSCSSYHCIHVTTLAKAMQIVEEDEMDSPLALFKCSFGITPEMRDYFELATLSKEKVSLFETGNENDASDFTDLPEKNGHKILAPSESGICFVVQSGINVLFKMNGCT